MKPPIMYYSILLVSFECLSSFSFQFDGIVSPWRHYHPIVAFLCLSYISHLKYHLPQCHHHFHLIQVDWIVFERQICTLRVCLLIKRNILSRTSELSLLWRLRKVLKRKDHTRGDARLLATSSAPNLGKASPLPTIKWGNSSIGSNTLRTSVNWWQSWVWFHCPCMVRVNSRKQQTALSI